MSPLARSAPHYWGPCPSGWWPPRAGPWRWYRRAPATRRLADAVGFSDSSLGANLWVRPQPVHQGSQQAILPSGLSPAATQAWRSAPVSAMAAALQIAAVEAAGRNGLGHRTVRALSGCSSYGRGAFGRFRTVEADDDDALDSSVAGGLTTSQVQLAGGSLAGNDHSLISSTVGRPDPPACASRSGVVGSFGGWVIYSSLCAAAASCNAVALHRRNRRRPVASTLARLEAPPLAYAVWCSLPDRCVRARLSACTRESGSFKHLFGVSPVLPIHTSVGLWIARRAVRTW